MWIVSRDASRAQWLRPQLGSSLEVLEHFPQSRQATNILLLVDDLNDEFVLQAIRFVIAHRDKNIKAAVVKVDGDEKDETKLQQIVRDETAKQVERLQRQIDRLRTASDNGWRSERMEQLEKWKSNCTANGRVQLFPASNNIKYDLDDFFTVAPLIIDEDYSQISPKRPVLHWTPQPLSGQSQVLLRFVFPLTGPSESDFRDVCSSLRDTADTSSEWIDGMLITTELATMHFERLTPQLYEAAVRVSADELEEHDRVGRFVWPLLANALSSMLTVLERHPSLEYTISLVPYDSSFYSPELKCRLFDFFLFMSTARTHSRVSTTANGVVHDVKLDQLIPGGALYSLSSLLSYRTSARVSKPADCASIARNNNKESLAPVHNKTRRVSFGVIRAFDEAEGGFTSTLLDQVSS